MCLLLPSRQTVLLRRVTNEEYETLLDKIYNIYIFLINYNILINDKKSIRI